MLRKVWSCNIYFHTNISMPCTQLRDIAKVCRTDNASNIKKAISCQQCQFHALRIRRMLAFCICACFWCDVIKVCASNFILFAMLNSSLVCLNACLSVLVFACLRPSLFVCLCACLFFVCMRVCLQNCMPVCLPVSMSACVSACQHASACQHVSFDVSASLHACLNSCSCLFVIMFVCVCLRKRHVLEFCNYACFQCNEIKQSPFGLLLVLRLLMECLYACLSVCICLCVHLFVRASVCLSVCQSVCLCVQACVSARLRFVSIEIWDWRPAPFYVDKWELTLVTRRAEMGHAVTVI